MRKKEGSLVIFLKKLMRERKLRPSPLAYELGVSHAAVSRWLSGKDVPSVKSCHKLAGYTNVPLEQILSIVGYLPELNKSVSAKWPEFREYALQKYPNELDDDLITLIEDLIKYARNRRD